MYGPVGSSWWTERGLEPRDDHAGGRLYVYDTAVENGPIIQEYPIAVMDQLSWAKLNFWSNRLETSEILTLDQLLTKFHEDTQTELGWLLIGDARQEIELTTPGEI